MLTANAAPTGSGQKNPLIAAMTAYLQPHAGNLEALWAHMEDAFMVVYGRAVDKTDAHDVMLCHAAVGPFNMEGHAP